MPYLFPPQSLTVESLCGRLASSVCVNTSTYRESLAFEQNTRYTTRRRGRGRAGVGAAGAGMGAGIGAGAGPGASAGILTEAVRKHQAEVAAPK